ncbi:ABC transporter substrate-binding protein [Nocardioides sp. GY 10113]|uniref:ABC transporter substrate-binding protein n=1 Tax=Nocardioides sp. GY 10113 TaxID=2569761 RepID=UPI0010A7E087|nr:ABC transporter substrate-binding protein [Nocardioides sp. GY 10113]TIC87592.1 ABC transporter substrate-binding protein [Nocardioides sp. GY 10113]
MRHPGPPRRRKTYAALGVAALALGGLAACGGDDGGVPVINLYGGASAAGFDKIIDDCNEQADGKYKIVGNLIPSDADGQREQFVRRLAAKDDGMDLLNTDVTWTAEFAEAGWIRELTGDQKAAASEDVLAPALATATWDDKLYGIPKSTNVQLLWYRKSLVPEAPTTWEQVAEEAQRLADEGKPHIIGMTAAQYEGYVVVFNTILSSLGGTLVNEDSTAPTVDEKTVEALDIISNFANSDLASASLGNSQEPEVFAQMQNGEAAFILNWPYVLSAMRQADPEIAKDLGFARIPEFEPGTPARATLGGSNLTISEYSNNPDLAYEAAMCLRSPEHQLQTALEAGDPPVSPSVYEEPEFQEAYPMYEVMLDELETAVPRPVTPLYQNISTIVSTTLSPPTSIDPQQTADELEGSIQDAIDGKGILP